MKEIDIKVLYKDDSGKEPGIHDLFPGLIESDYNFVTSNNPDFVLFRQTGDSNYFDYNCVRILLEPERYTPDFNICDYAISDCPIQFGDRHFQMPYLAQPYLRNEWLNAKTECEKNFTEQDLRNKEMFCNFIYSNGRGDKMRKTLFDLLSTYKLVHSGGGLFNNIGYQIGSGENKYKDKIKFQSGSKFTLAVENLSAPGYTTEKILHAFAARTIPIYWGDPMINEIFNKEAFIDCNDYNSLEEVLEKVKEIDSDDEKYIKMLNSSIFNENFNPEQLEKDLAKFLVNIFNQPAHQAFRRTRVLHSLHHEGFLRRGKKKYDRNIYIKTKIRMLFEKLGMENSVLYKKCKRHINRIR